MRYVFFDIECCNGRDICEFGYITTDEELNIMEQECITINPEAVFNLIGRRGRPDLILAYPYNVYRSSPTFPTYHKKIKDLLTREDQMVFGFSTGNDVRFLGNMCQKYGLEYIKFPYVDLQKLYDSIEGDGNTSSLDAAQEEMNSEGRGNGIHRSDLDSIQTRDLLRTICNKLSIEPKDVINICTECYHTADDRIFSDIECKKIKKYGDFFRMLDDGEADKIANTKDFVNDFKYACRPSAEIYENSLKGKKIVLSKNLDLEYPKDIIIITQILKNAGAECVTSLVGASYYVASGEEIRDNNDGINVKSIFYATLYNVAVITPDEFFNMAGTSMNEIRNMKCTTFCRTSRGTVEKPNKKPVYSDPNSSVTPTIGDLVNKQKKNGEE